MTRLIPLSMLQRSPFRTLLASITLIATAAASLAAEDGQQRVANRLAGENSPYLLQHAYNPVDWYPWGTEAFEAAELQDKPIFLSIGYSTCHWCHVMERESFEDADTARLLNESFVCIKLDREERPDIDDIYGAALRAMGVDAGWPVSLFLDWRSLSPYAGGTYFPAIPRDGQVAFPTLVHEAARAWQDDRGRVVVRARRMMEMVRMRLARTPPKQPVEDDDVVRARASLMRVFDHEHGGFRRGAPKFPLPSTLSLLIETGWDERDVQAAIVKTLDAMATGGLYDQVGGGFHRYSTDRQWIVPHFEKMLYDNAQLASIYATVVERTGNDFYRRIVRETLDYVLREMTHPAGGFFSAQDAGVDGREGASYVWTRAAVAAALRAAGLDEEIDLAVELYDLSGRGEFRDPHRSQDPLRHVLYLMHPPDRLALDRGIARSELDRRLARIDAALLAARSQRSRPLTDDKIITAWNGLMIAAMADGARVLGDDRYIEAAERAADFVMAELRRADGGLLRSWRQGEGEISAFLLDYAAMIRGLIALHRATGDDDRLEQARALADQARRRFWNDSAGGYYDTEAEQPYLFVRTISTRDGVLPCGNSLMLHNLLDLAEQTGDRAYLTDATRTLESISGALRTNPVNTALATAALHRFVQEHPALIGMGGGPKLTTDPVRIQANVEQLVIATDEPGSFEITLDIAAGYHINAHEPGQPRLVGLDVSLVGGAGLELDVRYPPGEPMRGGVRVHRHRLTLPITVRKVGEVEGRPRLMIVYQICTERECLPSEGVIVPVRIDVR